MTTKHITPYPRSGKNPLTRSEDEYPFVTFLQEMNRMMDGFFHGLGLTARQEMPGAFVPKIDVLDTEKDIMITAELPGMEQKDIDISLTKETVTVKGEKKTEKEEKRRGYHQMERSYGTFSRTIQLPAEINGDSVVATFSKGILTITLPKAEKVLQEVKKIAIKSE